MQKLTWRYRARGARATCTLVLGGLLEGRLLSGRLYQPQHVLLREVLSVAILVLDRVAELATLLDDLAREAAEAREVLGDAPPHQSFGPQQRQLRRRAGGQRCARGVREERGRGTVSVLRPFS